ncbi:MAG: DUF3987 domain-containing protein [Methylobacter sp.]
MSGIPNSYNNQPLIHAWTYLNATGKPLGIVGRYQIANGKKDVVPFFKRSGKNLAAGIDSSSRPLFGLDKLALSSKDKAVFIVEGEKPAAALQGLGVCAVTSLGGSQAANKADWTPLSGYKLAYLLPDNDEPGEHYIQDVYRALMALESPPVVKVLRLSELPPAGDVVDWLQGWLNDWDGYQSIDTNRHEALKEELKTELQKAEPVPVSWTATAKATTPGGFTWGVAGEIEPKTPKVEALRLELLPEPFRPWLADVSHRMQTPGDFAAISAIVITSSIIGAGCGIRPKALDSWEVIPNLWGACIGRPSVVLKSPSMKEPMQLLDRLQHVYGEIYDREKKEGDFDEMLNASILKDLKTQLDKQAKGSGKDRVCNPHEIDKLKHEFMELSNDAKQEPARRMFKTNESSIQSMTLLQNQNPRGLLVFRDELTGLLSRWDREDSADERAYFLEGWNGNGSYTDCKIGRGVTEAKQLCISLLGGIQPDKLKKYLHQAQVGNNDGMMQRLQLAVWPDEPKDWQLIDMKPDREAKHAAFLILQKLAEMNFVDVGATQTSHDDRPYFRFSEAGQMVFNEWLTQLQTVKIKQEENPLMVEHFGKFRSLMPSLALIFHCIDIADNKASGAVSERAALLAVEWCKYLESHARRIYAMAESREQEAAARLAGRIKGGCLPNPFTTKSVYDKGWHGLCQPKAVEAACDVLIDEGWLLRELRAKPATGRPPAPEYHINPAVL